MFLYFFLALQGNGSASRVAELSSVLTHTALDHSPLTRVGTDVCRDNTGGIQSRLKVRRSGVGFPAEARNVSLSKLSRLALEPTQPEIERI
jgi:hypothetical protein